MKESDAKQKRCCGPEPSNTGTPAPLNDYPENIASMRQTAVGLPTIYLCSGSECMMWIATDNEYEPQKEPRDPEAVIPEPECYPAGYCGLTGK